MPLLLRNEEPAEEMVFTAFRGKCRYCGGVVIISRSWETHALEPDRCHCLLCGQPYYLKTADLKQWEQDQWCQKEQKRG